MPLGWRLNIETLYGVYNNNMSYKTSPLALSGSMLYNIYSRKGKPFPLFTHENEPTKNEKLQIGACKKPPRLRMICAEAVAKDEMLAKI